ncbi:MAG: AAA family ATPase [Candidatus Sulfotelmatobacter sp.]
MFEFLKHVLSGQNQFASGGLLLMIVGAVGAYLRAIPSRIWYWIVGQTTLSITVKDEDAAFAWVKQWFAEQKFLKRIRRVDLDTTVRNENLALIPAPGRHWFWYRGRPFRVDFYRSEDTRGWTPKRSELLVFQTVGRDQSLLKSFVTEIASCHKKHERVRSSLYVYSEYWGSVEGYNARLLDSVILQTGERERLVSDIEKFKSAKARYRRLGVPYHRGYLLYGPPGTGKTSLVSAIAGKFAMSIYAINLTDFNDRSLTKAMNDVPPGSVVLFEDVDCMIASNPRSHAEKPSPGDPREKPEAKTVADKFGVTLSGLLNVLDGFHAPDDVLYMMTTNKIEALDPALLRPGRIDYRLYLGVASEEQKLELYRRFFPLADEFEARAFVEAHPWAETMADFQGLLLEHAEKPAGSRFVERLAEPSPQQEDEVPVPALH